MQLCFYKRKHFLLCSDLLLRSWHNRRHVRRYSGEYCGTYSTNYSQSCGWVLYSAVQVHHLWKLGSFCTETQVLWIYEFYPQVWLGINCQDLTQGVSYKKNAIGPAHVCDDSWVGVLVGAEDSKPIQSSSLSSRQD